MIQFYVLFVNNFKQKKAAGGSINPTTVIFIVAYQTNTNQ